MQYDAFSYPGLDQLITTSGRYRWRTRGRMGFPSTFRMPYGGGVRAPELHDDSPETYYAHTPGIKVVMPSTPADAKGLLRRRSATRTPWSSSSRSSSTHRARRGARGRDASRSARRAWRARGRDVTLVAYGAMVASASGPPTSSKGRRRSRCSTCARWAARRGDARSRRPRRRAASWSSRRRRGPCGFARRAGGDPRREGDPRPAGAGRSA